MFPYDFYKLTQKKHHFKNVKFSYYFRFSKSKALSHVFLDIECFYDKIVTTDQSHTCNR